VKIFLFTIGLVFCMNIFAESNSVWFECDQENKGKFKGFPKTLGFFHDLPKNKSRQITKITYLNVGRVTWQTGDAISNSKRIQIRMETIDGLKTPSFDREKLTFAGMPCKLSDEESVLKKKNEMIEIQLKDNKI